jgi:hypothetical protein
MIKTPADLRRLVEENESVRRCFVLADLEQLLNDVDAQWPVDATDDIKEQYMKDCYTRLEQLKGDFELVPRHQLRVETTEEKDMCGRIHIYNGEPQLSVPIVLDRDILISDAAAAAAVRELVVMDVSDLAFAAQYLPNVSIVYFHDAFDTPLQDELLALGNTLKEVHFGIFFNQSIARTAWPARLQTLTFGYYFNQPIATELHGLPVDMRRITLGAAFNQPVEKLVLPAHLQLLSFKHCFVRPVEHLVLPDTLIGFGLLSERWAHSAALPRLPASLTTLQLSHRIFEGAEQIQQVRLGLHRNVQAAGMAATAMACNDDMADCTIM